MYVIHTSCYDEANAKLVVDIDIVPQIIKMQNTILTQRQSVLCFSRRSRFIIPIILWRLSLPSQICWRLLLL